MEIFRGYTSSDVLFDEPFTTKTLKLYPIKVNQYKEFTQYINYFLFSKKHYGIENKVNLFEYTIAINISRIKNNYSTQNKEVSNTDCIIAVTEELGRAFSIICREEIYVDNYALQETGEIVFINKNKTICINKGNYEIVRQVVLKQNVIVEPKIFEDEIERKLAEKYLKAQSKNNKGVSGLGEMANVVSCATGKTYEQLYEQNVMQLYVDYYRCINTENYRTTALFRTVDSKVKVTNYSQEVISQLFKDPYEGMWKDRSQIFG